MPFSPITSSRLTFLPVSGSNREKSGAVVPRGSIVLSVFTMVMTESTMLPLGTTAPDFSLLEPLTGRKVSLDEVMGEKGICIMFMCNHCPFVKHVAGELKKVGKDLPELGIGVVGISANDMENFPEDNLENMAKAAKKQFSTFKYLADESQEVAKSYKAACTPDFYIFDKDKKLKYRGKLDKSTPSNGQPVNGQYLREAAKAIAAGQDVKEQNPSMGCNIKWKEGNEPPYFG